MPCSTRLSFTLHALCTHGLHSFADTVQDHARSVLDSYAQRAGWGGLMAIGGLDVDDEVTCTTYVTCCSSCTMLY